MADRKTDNPFPAVLNFFAKYWVLTALALVFFLVFSFQPEAQIPTEATASKSTSASADYKGNSPFNDPCIQRGVKYFGDIGSWPKLTDGRDTLTVIKERCSRTNTAF